MNDYVELDIAYIAFSQIKSETSDKILKLQETNPTSTHEGYKNLFMEYRLQIDALVSSCGWTETELLKCEYSQVDPHSMMIGETLE